MLQWPHDGNAASQSSAAIVCFGRRVIITPDATTSLLVGLARCRWREGRCDIWSIPGSEMVLLYPMHLIACWFPAHL